MAGATLQGSALLSEEEVREKASCPPQSYFQVKEGNGVGRKAINKITDLIIVEEEVVLLHCYLWSARFRSVAFRIINCRT